MLTVDSWRKSLGAIYKVLNLSAAIRRRHAGRVTAPQPEPTRPQQSPLKQPNSFTLNWLYDSKIPLPCLRRRGNIAELFP